MDYQVYSVQEFVMDEFFQQWVKYEQPEAKAFWELWLLQHPEKVHEVEEARRILQALDFIRDEPTEEQQEQMYSHIMEAVHRHETARRDREIALPLRSLRNWYRVAAALAILLVAGTVIWWYTMRTVRQVTYATDYGETQTIILPDQSEVVLNANSTLQYAANWQSQLKREVWLNGEAFFRVRKKTQGETPVKFTVHSGSLKVEVLGTQFNVSKRQEKTHVALHEGRIRLEIPTQKGTESILMRPGELIEYQINNRKVVKRMVNTAAYSAWTSNKWVLEEMTLREVANRIEETYGVKVDIPDARLARESMTGVLPTESFDKLLQVLTTTYSIQIQRKENQLTLTKLNQAN